MSKRLRILLNVNAPWASSGYAQQAYDLVPLIKNEGYEIAVSCFYGLEGGSIMLDGIKFYPKIGDPWGVDAMINHAQDFKADVVMSLQDTWVLNPVELGKIKRWIPICVDGNTTVSFVDGRILKIKDVVENKISGEVWGYKNGEIIPSIIKSWQKIPKKMDVYELKTKSSNVLITGNNEVFVNNQWKRADRIKIGDMVYLQYDEPSNKEQNNEKHNFNKNRSGILSWFIGRRGNNNDNESHEKEPKDRDKTHYPSVNSNNQHRRKDDNVGAKCCRCEDEQQNEKYREQIQPLYKKIIQGLKGLFLGGDMGIQLSSNPPTNNTIYDNEKRTFRIGCEVHNFSSETTANKIQSTIYPRGDRNMGENSHLKPEIVMAIKKVKSPKRTVYDISTETGNFFANKILVHNCPVDHDPVPAAIFDRLRSAYRVITYSKFGHDQLQSKGMHSTYIQHTVDTDIFTPLDKNAMRKELNIKEDVFLFGMVGANKDNPPRKGFQHGIDAFAKFHKAHPKSALYIHTLLQQQGGFPIEDYVKFLGISESIYHLQPYEQLFKVHRNDMKKIYSAFDALLMPSENEGFGVPIIEAQACGVPVITNDFTATGELVQHKVTGELCKISYKKFTPLLSYVGVPDIENLYNAMEHIYDADRVKMGIAARDFIVNNYDTEKVFTEKWIPFLSMIEEEIYGKEVPKT
ncbi:MAG: glycosyltransferase [Patescibacteria group bacterium]